MLSPQDLIDLCHSWPCPWALPAHPPYCHLILCPVHINQASPVTHYSLAQRPQQALAGEAWLLEATLVGGRDVRQPQAPHTPAAEHSQILGASDSLSQ